MVHLTRERKWEDLFHECQASVNFSDEDRSFYFRLVAKVILGYAEL